MFTLAISVVASIANFVKDVASGTISNIAAERIATVFIQRDVQENLRKQVRSAFRVAIIKIFDHYISSPPFERLSATTQDLVMARRDWLGSDEVARELIPDIYADDILLNAEQVNALFTFPVIEVNTYLIRYLLNLGALEGLPSGLERSLRESLLVGIQVEFAKRMMISESATRNLLFFERLLSIKAETKEIATNLHDLRAEFEKNLLSKSEVERWNKVLEDLDNLHENIYKLPQRTAEAVVDQLKTVGMQVSPNLSLSLSNTLDHQSVNKLFNSKVRLVKLTNIAPASYKAVQRYYEGARLTWNILSAHGDVERNQRNVLIQKYCELESQTRMLCMIGEPGSGKSTLAWRIAAEIAQLNDRPLLHILDNADDEIWYKLETLSQDYAMPLVVLVDDIYRDENAVNALSSLRPDLNITIIATSRSNEIPNDLRLPFLIEIVKLNVPKENEKKRVLQKLGIHEHTLDKAQQKRLLQANSWLVLMLETTTGEALSKIILDSVNRLRQQDEIVYRAYEYLCYAGQYDLAVPETLMAALDDHGHFYNLLEHPAGRDLIFGNKREATLSTLHSTIAHEAMKAYRRDPKAIANDFISVLEPTRSSERLFLKNVFSRLLLEQQTSLLWKLLNQHAIKIITVIENCGVADLIQWAKLYYTLGDLQKAAYIEAKALSKVPEGPQDWLACFKLLGQKGTMEQLSSLIDLAAAWLVANPKANDVFIYYLKLLESQGKEEQVEAGINAAINLLTSNPNNRTVCQACLKLLNNYLKEIESSIDLQGSLVYDKARRLFEKVTYVVPTYAGFWESWAEMEKALGNYQEARRLFEKATQVAPNYAPSWQAWAEMEKDQGNYEEARRLFEKTTQVAPNYAPSWQVWGQMEKGLGNYNEARRLFGEGTKFAPKYAPTWQTWAGMEKDLGNYQEARRLFEKVTKVAPNYVPSWQAWAEMEKEQGNDQEACQLFEKAVKKVKYSALSFQNKAHLEKDLSKSEKVQRLFREATNAFPQHLSFWQAWAEMEKALGNYKEARRLFQKVSKSMPDNIAVWRGWAEMEKDQGNYEEARRLFQEAVKIAPDNMALWAKMEKDLGNYQQARRLYQEAIKIAPDNMAAWRGWALLELEDGNDKEAIQLAQQAMNLSPHDFNTLIVHGQINYVLGNMDHAKDDFEQAKQILQSKLEDFPNNTLFLNLLGRVYTYLGMYQKAEKTLYLCLNLSPDNKKHFVYNELGKLYEDQKMFDQAIEKWKKALDFAPQFLEARKNIDSIREKLKSDVE